MRRCSRRTCVAGSVAAALLASTSPARAAEPIETIVVTARKRQENLQDVPLSVTAFGEEALREQGVRRVPDIARSVPNVAGVVNDVQIAGVSSTTSRSNDALITSAVKTRLPDTDMQFSAKCTRGSPTSRMRFS